MNGNGNSRSEERPSATSNVAKNISANMDDLKEKKRHAANNTQRNNQSSLTTGGKQSRSELEKVAIYHEMDARRGSGMMGVNAGDSNLFGTDEDREDEENKNVVNIQNINTCYNDYVKKQMHQQQHHVSNSSHNAAQALGKGHHNRAIPQQPSQQIAQMHPHL